MLDKILRDNLVYHDYERALKLLNEFDLIDKIEKAIEKNFDEPENRTLESEISDLESEVRDLEESLEEAERENDKLTKELEELKSGKKSTN